DETPRGATAPRNTGTPLRFGEGPGERLIAHRPRSDQATAARRLLIGRVAEGVFARRPDVTTGELLLIGGGAEGGFPRGPDLAGRALVGGVAVGVLAGRQDPLVAGLFLIGGIAAGVFARRPDVALFGLILVAREQVPDLAEEISERHGVSPLSTPRPSS